MDKIKHLKLPLRLEEEEVNCGLGGCSIEYNIRDAVGGYLAEVYDKEIAEEIVWACNQQIG